MQLWGSNTKHFMGLAKCVTLRMIVLVCLSLIYVDSILVVSPNGAEGQKERFVGGGGAGGSSGSDGTGDDYDDYNFSPLECADGLGNYESLPTGSCCCQQCGPGPGPVSLPDLGPLDPDEESCCPVDDTTTMAEAETEWGCCNCPDGVWIVRGNFSLSPGYRFGSSDERASRAGRERVRKVKKLAHKTFKKKYEKQERLWAHKDAEPKPNNEMDHEIGKEIVGDRKE